MIIDKKGWVKIKILLIFDLGQFIFVKILL